jgi:hypothetical protein
MMPLFPPTQCSCKQTWDPLGLHAAACPHLNAFSLLHNSVRDCFAGAARKCVSTDAGARVSYILTDKHAKSATWMHEFYPLKTSAPVILCDHASHRGPAPSLSPDILIAFVNDPLNPYFGDFVASSPSTSNKFRHGEAAQDKFVQKLRHYSKHHDYPSRVFYPLSFERSGYIHPAFDEFIDLFARCSSIEPQPHTALQLRFAVAFAITFTTASLLRSASHRLLPRSLSAFIPPKPLSVPACWAPHIPPPRANLPRTVNPHATPPVISSDIPYTANSPSVLYALQGSSRPALQSALHPAWPGAYSPDSSFSGALLQSRA